MPSQKDEIIRNRRRRQDKLEAMREEHKYEVSSEVEGQESSLQDGQTGPQHNSSLANHAEDSVSGEVEGQESSLQDGQTGPQHNSSLANHAEDSVSGEVEGQESSLQDGQTGPQHNSSLANNAEDSVSSEVEGQESSLQDGQTGPQHNSSLVYKRQQALLKQKIMEKRIKRAGKLIKSLPKPQKEGSQLRKKNEKKT
ncbi:hypothetical protein K438DRAFT_1759358 [Mycena galopus ATCC 62051]|nr:hypothetical protein K438DRAFT_1759358 [Mycena galopus ATCC 62051]